jgi:N-acetylmuramoyl-L-alanine amidase
MEERNLQLMKFKKMLTISLVTAIVYLQPNLVVAENTQPVQSPVEQSTSIPNIDNNKAQVQLVTWIGTVKLPNANLNVRTSPSLEANIIGKLANETQVEVLEQSAEWASITYENSVAYVSLQYLDIVKTIQNTDVVTDPTTNDTPITDVPPVSEDVGQASDNAGQASDEDQMLIGTVVLESGNLNVRKGPSMEEDIIGKLPNQSQVEILEQSTEWATISHNGNTGYVSTAYLNIARMNIEKQKDTHSGFKKVIVLDPGHGGKDPGAIAKDGTYESKLVWQYALQMKQSLEKSGYIVHMTRTDKNSCTAYKKIHDELDCRISLVNKVKGDIYISIHADANPKKTFRGTVTFYNDRSDLDGNINPFSKESKRLAQFIQSKVQPVIGSTNRGITNQNYYVNRMNTVPSVLVELGVMTNAADLKILKNNNNLDKVATALVKAVDLYFGY